MPDTPIPPETIAAMFGSPPVDEEAPSLTEDELAQWEREQFDDLPRILGEQIETAAEGFLHFLSGFESQYITPAAHQTLVDALVLTEAERGVEDNAWLDVPSPIVGSLFANLVARGGPLSDVEAIASHLTPDAAQRLYQMAVMVSKVQRYKTALRAAHGARIE